MGPIVTAATAAALPVGAHIVHVEAGDPAEAARAFADAHLPGAILLHRDEVASAPMAAGDGRHPLPPPEAFAEALGRHGIGADTAVVAYDREGGASAARLVYLLRILGQPAALLDGGLEGWEEEVETGPPAAPPVVEVRVRPWPGEMLPDADEVAAHIAADGLVLDARAAERYAGEVEPLDPVAGHIPGARNAPYAENLDRTGLFRAPPKLHATYAPMGAGPETIVYCGSGVTACHDLLAIEHAGLGLGRLYVGSWSQWCRDPHREVATGSDPARQG